MEAKPKLLDRVRDKIRTRHYGYPTEQRYVGWIRRYTPFRGKRHPAELCASDVERFLTHLAVEEEEEEVAASTQNRALGVSVQSRFGAPSGK